MTDASRQPKQVLLVGDYRHGEFVDAVEWLAEHTQLKAALDPAEALIWIRQGHFPDVIVLAQPRPGAVAQGTVERLHAASPVSRLVALLGSWCEGEQRSGHPCAGVVRIYWHQWQPRMVPELTASGWPAYSMWRLPRTSGPGEYSVHACRTPWPRRSGLIAIAARTHRTFEALNDACRLAGYATAWAPAEGPLYCDGLAAVLWDSDGREPDAAQRLEGLVQQYRPAPVIALMDMVRRQQVERAKAAGAAAVVAKPFLVRDLLWQLDAAVQRIPPSPPVSSAA